MVEEADHLTDATTEIHHTEAEIEEEADEEVLEGGIRTLSEFELNLLFFNFNIHEDQHCPTYLFFYYQMLTMPLAF